jgi:hypothetical protein
MTYRVVSELSRADFLICPTADGCLSAHSEL